MKKSLCFLTAAATLAFSINTISAQTDAAVFSDTPRAAYAARQDGKAAIAWASFADVSGHWAAEPIARSAALGLFKGLTGDNFAPGAVVSNAETAAFAVRLTGLETEAMARAAETGANLNTAWYAGYIAIAEESGLISSGIAPAAPATREFAADVFARSLRTLSKNAFPPVSGLLASLNFRDAGEIGAAYAESVEIMAANGVMTATGGYFRPKAAFTRAEAAQTLANLERFYFAAAALTRKSGTVAAAADSQYTTTGAGQAWRDILVRASDGRLDAIRFAPPADAPVYKNGSVGGLARLSEGDEISYVVNAAGELLYVSVTRGLTKSGVSGFLTSVDKAGLSVALRDSAGKIYWYSVAEGVMPLFYGMPYGARLSLSLVSGVVTDVLYIGDAEIKSELRGVVVENNPEYGYITVAVQGGGYVTKRYYAGAITVSKRRYFEDPDAMGYITRMFPGGGFDPSSADISEIEPGDVVFMTPDASDPELITEISAAADFVVKYGRIRSFADKGDTLSVTLALDGGGVAAFDIPDGVYISRDGKPVTPQAITVGEYARLLVVQAVVSPGSVLESVREIALEGAEHTVARIIKGELSGVDAIQETLTVAHAYTLSKTGWGSYAVLSDVKLAKSTEFYLNDRRIAASEAVRFYGRGGGLAYVATETGYAGETAAKVTIRLGRDEPLAPDSVLYTAASGAFGILSRENPIAAGEGSLVVKNGRLVSAADILPSDYARISLNDGGAAVVLITGESGWGDTMVARGRVLSVDEGRSFTVQSMSVLSNGVWSYTPVARVFEIDHNTVFLTADGASDIFGFIGYTDASALDKAYAVVAEGARAAFVIEAPHAPEAVKGTVYSARDGTLSLKDAYWRDKTTGKWTAVGGGGAVITVAAPANAAKSGEIAPGDLVTVMTDALQAPVRPNAEITGYIITVDK
ncbi:MAG: S-layer homology domain-containing protein [Clostridiales bacterium]|jgi:hypothetical protein|nr:S-layer homology domain-containing protein [Clostridiales bacterium]